MKNYKTQRKNRGENFQDLSLGKESVDCDTKSKIIKRKK